MTKAHLKCVNGLGIKVKQMPLFTSEAWDISSEDAEKLLGGIIYFHDTKRKPSYFGGIVRGYQIIDTNNAHSERVVFTIEATREAKGKPWSGRNHTYAHYSGVMD